ncbi:hypothetical protein M6D81_12215 [Paenibacillus sp. J5C_2022]|nr:hypothetical protein [Paenibacillus sp. J5C2022]MCU6709468.1 hypothetical protein [Paenibacillus sp. J5C2022]
MRIVLIGGGPFQSAEITGFLRKHSLDNVNTVIRFVKGVGCFEELLPYSSRMLSLERAGMQGGKRLRRRGASSGRLSHNGMQGHMILYIRDRHLMDADTGNIHAALEPPRIGIRRMMEGGNHNESSYSGVAGSGSRGASGA